MHNNVFAIIDREFMLNDIITDWNVLLQIRRLRNAKSCNMMFSLCLKYIQGGPKK